jgi:hypothetical protein
VLEFLVSLHKLQFVQADCRRQHGWHGNYNLPETVRNLTQEVRAETRNISYDPNNCKKELQYVSSDCVLKDGGSFTQFTYQRICIGSFIPHFSTPSTCRSAEYRKYRNLVPTTEGFFFPCYKEQCSPAVRAVCVVTHVATVSITSTREAITLQELVVSFAWKRREVAAWGYRISEKLVGTSVVTEASAFHIRRS